MVRGAAGARLLYDEESVRRRDAVPHPLADLLFGSGAVHTLDDEAHRERKRVFLRALAPGEVGRLAAAVADDLERRIAGWPERGEVMVFDELVAVYGPAVLRWAGRAGA